MGGDDTQTDGGPIEGNGLTLKFATKAGMQPVSLPEQIDAKIKLDEIRLFATSVRVDGNGGTQFTTKTNWHLKWELEMGPASEMFAQAPTGRYSAVEVQIQRMAGSETDAVFIKGEVKRDGEQNFRDFDIESRNSIIPVEVMIDTNLAPGQAATVSVDLDTLKLFANIDWESMTPNGDGDFELDDGDPEMATFRTNIANAFVKSPIQ